MKRILPFLLASLALAAFAAASFAQSSDPSSADKSAPAAQSSSQAPAASATPAPDASAAPATQATPSEAPAAAAAPASTPAMDRIKETGMKAAAKERGDVEKKLDELERQIETEAMKGEPVVAGRVAPEFGVTADALVAEKGQYGRGFGELVVAHTLVSNAKTDATMSDLFALRSEGMGWGAIAAGLNLRLGDVVGAVRSEQRVAAGLEKADGKAATIQMASASSTKAPKAEKTAKHAKSDTKASEAGTGVGGGMDMNKATGK